MQALARLAPAHLTAIHLYGGPDYEPMKTFLNGERLGAGWAVDCCASASGR
ncbi:hypothetical protein NKH18_15120 [Streptomyces sp. M10(2022)]